MLLPRFELARPDSPAWRRWMITGPGLFLAAALLVAAFLRVKISLTDDGIYWPDEVYQSLEPAHRLVFGYGLIAWEFVQGARNWALPGIVAGLFSLAKAVKLEAPGQYLGLTRLVFSAMSIGCAFGVWALARALGATRWPAAVAAAAYALCSVTLYFSHRAMSENAAALPVILGLWLLVENASRGRRLLGASLIGAAVLLRLQCGVFCIAVLVWQLVRRRFRHAAESLGVFAVWAFAFGWLDHFTWVHAPGARYGGWFHSAICYLQFNLVQGRAAAWGVSPWQYYGRTLEGAMPVLVAVSAIAALLALRRAFFVLATMLFFIAAHSLIPHKELRFILPALPLLFALAAAGLMTLPRGIPRAVGILALALAGAHSASRYRKLTFGDLGAYADRATVSAWDDYGPVNRLLKKASALPDLCGIRVDAPTAWMGGFSYLHRKAPIYPWGYLAAYHHFNYAILAAGGGAPVIATSGDFELVQYGGPTCDKDPGYTWLLY